MPDVSFEGADAERTIVHRRDGWCGFDRRRRGGGRHNRRLVFGDGLQKCRGRHEEQVSGDGAAEVKQSVVIAGRATDEHVFEHLLSYARRTTVADEIGAEFTLAGLAERHVVA